MMVGLTSKPLDRLAWPTVLWIQSTWEYGIADIHACREIWICHLCSLSYVWLWDMDIKWWRRGMLMPLVLDTFTESCSITERTSCWTINCAIKRNQSYQPGLWNPTPAVSPCNTPPEHQPAHRVRHLRDIGPSACGGMEPITPGHRARGTVGLPQFTFCESEVTTPCLTSRTHSLLGEQGHEGIGKKHPNFSTPPEDQTRDLSVVRRVCYRCTTEHPRDAHIIHGYGKLTNPATMALRMYRAATWELPRGDRLVVVAGGWSDSLPD